MRRLVLLLLVLALAAPAGAETVTLGIVFPEGWSARQMADRAAEVRRITIRKRHVTPALTGAAYAHAAAAARPPDGWGRRRSIEGFLFPARYDFLPSTTAAEIVATQITTFSERWSTVDVQVDRSPYEVLTVASMVERETVVPAERKLVAAVIYNRLAKGMPLAIDATLRYGLGVPGNKSLTKEHLASDSPYNTRRFKGLPPTPIGNPGLASLRAAANPADVDYLYYVRKPDRRHHFFTADENEFCEQAKAYG